MLNYSYLSLGDSADFLKHAHAHTHKEEKRPSFNIVSRFVQGYLHSKWFIKIWFTLKVGFPRKIKVCMVTLIHITKGA